MGGGEGGVAEERRRLHPAPLQAGFEGGQTASTRGTLTDTVSHFFEEAGIAANEEVRLLELTLDALTCYLPPPPL
jgi:hypothetical protein